MELKVNFMHIYKDKTKIRLKSADDKGKAEAALFIITLDL